MKKIKKYLAIFKYSLKAQLTFLPDYLFSMFSFTIHIFIFSELWDYILRGKDIVGYNKSELMWYIIIAECVTYSVIKSHKKIGEMVKNGDVANMLLKPVDMISYFIAENSAVIIKGIINIGLAIILGFAFAGPIKVSVISLVYTLVAVFIGIIIEGLVQIFIGIIAFYTEENESFYFVIQKLGLLAVFTPLEFYPEILQKLLFFLPTTQMVYAPSKIFAKFNIETANMLIIIEIMSALVMYVLLRIMYKKGVEKINLNGG